MLAFSVNKAKSSRGCIQLLWSVDPSMGIFFLYIMSACHPYIGVPDIQFDEPDIWNPDVMNHNDDISTRVRVRLVRTRVATATINC